MGNKFSKKKDGSTSPSSPAREAQIAVIKEAIKLIRKQKNLEVVEVLGGSGGNIKVKDKTENKTQVWKMRKSREHAEGEVNANQVYKNLGCKVPDTSVKEVGKQVFVIQDFLEGRTLLDARKKNDEEAVQHARERLGEHFVVDCLLANWDVIGGRNGDNIIIDESGDCWRIDNAGVFSMRAQGERKPEASWSEPVTELYLMRDIESGNEQAADIFKNITTTDIAAQLLQISTRDDVFTHLPERDLSIIRSRVGYVETFIAASMNISEDEGQNSDFAKELIAMGFEPAAAELALQQTNNNLQAAIDLLA
eukprot:TRINITY_DN1794_c1_g1_i1.p1 TRINITY_DN1794_c1_g1~~TRINITY_DN1794_c1_g1_i1.p1  ORF type:complete len:323 (+),score=73.05 TRINITY_DN1794_c1_g1_i1:48-971(+)